MKYENKYFIFDHPRDTGIIGLMKEVAFAAARMIYSFMYCFIRPGKNQKKKKYEVSILAIFKNEANYLKEWIEYHRIVGVDHFYLYNNNSEDCYLDVLEPYVKQGIVTLNDWQKNQAQMECYANGIENFRDETEWIAIIDIDEFIVINQNKNIAEFLRNYKNKPAVVCNWKFFGTSGKMVRDRNGLVTEDFTVAWRKYSNMGKCIYNTSYDIDCADKKNKVMHHLLWAKFGRLSLPPVNVFNLPCLFEYNVIPRYVDKNAFPIQLNHYFTKSLGEYLEKKSKGDVYFKENPHDMDYFFEHEKKCQTEDYSAYKYLIELKIAMEKSRKKEE